MHTFNNNGKLRIYEPLL